MSSVVIEELDVLAKPEPIRNLKITRSIQYGEFDVSLFQLGEKIAFDPRQKFHAEGFFTPSSVPQNHFIAFHIKCREVDGKVSFRPPLFVVCQEAQNFKLDFLSLIWITCDGNNNTCSILKQNPLLGFGKLSIFIAPRFTPIGHYHWVKRSQRVQWSWKRETFPLFLKHDVINFRLLFSPTMPPEVAGMGKHENFFNFFSSSLIYSFPHSRKCRFLASFCLYHLGEEWRWRERKEKWMEGDRENFKIDKLEFEMSNVRSISESF